MSGEDLRGPLIGQGGSSEVFAWGEHAVLKLFRPEYQYAVVMEADRTRAVHAAGVPCPAVIDVVNVEGRQGIVFDRVDGPTLLDDLKASPKDPGPVGRRPPSYTPVCTRTRLPIWRDSSTRCNGRLPISRRNRGRRPLPASPGSRRGRR
jgi:hypothetical protein